MKENAIDPCESDNLSTVRRTTTTATTSTHSTPSDKVMYSTAVEVFREHHCSRTVKVAYINKCSSTYNAPFKCLHQLYKICKTANFS